MLNDTTSDTEQRIVTYLRALADELSDAVKGADSPRNRNALRHHSLALSVVATAIERGEYLKPRSPAV